VISKCLPFGYAVTVGSSVPAVQRSLLPPFVENAEKRFLFYAPFTRYNNAYVFEDLSVIPKGVFET